MGKRIIEMPARLYKKYLQRHINKFKEHWLFYTSVALTAVYLYGIIVNSFIMAVGNFAQNSDAPVFTLNPLKCFAAVFSVYGFGIAFFVFVMYMLIKKDWLGYITGVKVKKDERNFYTVNEGTHGTSGWMDKKDIQKTFLVGEADTVEGPILGKIDSGDYCSYLGMNTNNGLNRHVLIYGASGAGKTFGFVKPFILKTVQLGESLVIVDPKAELAALMAEYLKSEGYVVKMFNLLDMENSDAWNCLGEIEGDVDMVQAVAEVIIKNTSDNEQKPDVWDKAEKNLLVALIHYVLTLTDPDTGELLPIYQRSLGTIYDILSTEGVNSLNAMMQKLPLEHPARAPYGVFKQAASNLWGNIFIGLGSRLGVFQNKLVKKITAYHEIDLELPGKQKCAYFCIISAQDSSLEFLSSLFFSLLFKKLANYSHKHGDERGRLPCDVNMLLDEFNNVGKIPDFKRILSVVRSQGVNCQIITQSAAQLADRYPNKEWEEIVGNCDTQLMLGCNDEMTAEFISKRCGNITIRTTSSMAPQTPLFSPVTNEVRGYKQNTSNATRPLMYPEEIQQMDNSECLILVRGRKPIKAKKITPLELSSYKYLKHHRVTDYVPKWRQDEESGNGDVYEGYTDIGFSDDIKDEPEEIPVISPLRDMEVIPGSVGKYMGKNNSGNADNKAANDDIVEGKRKPYAPRQTNIKRITERNKR